MSSLLLISCIRATRCPDSGSCLNQEVLCPIIARFPSAQPTAAALTVPAARRDLPCAWPWWPPCQATRDTAKPRSPRMPRQATLRRSLARWLPSQSPEAYNGGSPLVAAPKPSGRTFDRPKTHRPSLRVLPASRVMRPARRYCLADKQTIFALLTEPRNAGLFHGITLCLADGFSALVIPRGDPSMKHTMPCVATAAHANGGGFFGAGTRAGDAENHMSLRASKSSGLAFAAQAGLKSPAFRNSCVFQ